MALLITDPPDPSLEDKADAFLRTWKVAIFIVAYNAEKHLEGVIERIPRRLLPLFAEVFVIDDSSTDSTFSVAGRVKAKYPQLSVYRTPTNRGYGGNQKLGYLYCAEKGYDFVILLHGDGQYPPEYIPLLLSTFDEDTDAVFGSRMVHKRMALKGGMPLYKWIGNQMLTAFENRLLGLKLTEFHTGFRAYRVESLRKIPFVFNSDDFHFDTEIVIQAVATNWRIREVAIPTRYAGEVCHVNGLHYAFNCMRSVLQYLFVRLGLFYRRNYDFGLFETDNYQFKKSPVSLHQYVLRHGEFEPEMRTIELGANRGVLSSYIADRVASHVAVDHFMPDLAGKSETRQLDLETRFSEAFPDSFDCCVALDVIEHLESPEFFLSEVFQILRTGGRLYVSTANICYFPMRISLLMGRFNYGKRGILDMTHKRLFSVRSFKKLIRQYGFRMEKLVGFPPPLTDLVSRNTLVRWIEKLHAFLSRHFPNLFAYNFLVVACRLDGIADIFRLTIHPDDHN